MSSAAAHRDTVASLADRLPGDRYWPPNPTMMIRPSGRPERYCAYETITATTPIHFHAMAEMTLILQGTGTLRIAGQDYHAAPHVLALAPPNVLHAQQCERPLNKLVCMFDLGIVEPLLARDRLFGHLKSVGTRFSPVVQLESSEAAIVADLIGDVLAEHRASARLGSGAVAGALLTQMLVQFLRHATEHDTPVATAPAVHEDDEYSRILGFVQEHFTEPINRSTVARACDLRPEAVSRLFRRADGDSFTTYLTRLRLGHALELLQSTTLSATEVSRLSGFDSYRTFARTFSHHYGHSPRTFRDTLH